MADTVLLYFQEGVDWLVAVLAHIDVASEGLAFQGLHLRYVRFSLLNFECQFYLILLQCVDVLLIEQRTCRIGSELPLFQLFVVELLQGGNLLGEVLLLGQHILQVLVLKDLHVELVLLCNISLRLKIFEFLGFLSQLLLLELKGIQTGLHLLQFLILLLRSQLLLLYLPVLLILKLLLRLEQL